MTVDSSVEVTQDIDLKGRYGSGMDLLGKLPGSQAVRDCMAAAGPNTLTVGRWTPASPRRPNVLQTAQARFRQNGDLVQLLAAIASSESFRSVRISDGSGGNGP